MGRKETESVNADSTPVTGSSRAGNIVQAIILLVTVYLSALNFRTTEDHTALFVTLISTAVVFALYVVIRYRGKGSRNDVKSQEYQGRELPSFNIVYVLYLPFMLSLLFKPELVPVHCAMALNIVDMPLVMRIPIQIAVLLFNYGNSSMVTTGLVGIFINVLLCSALEQVSELKSLDEVDCNLFSMLLTDVLYLIHSDTLHFSVLRSCLMGFLTAVSVNYSISSKLNQIHPLLRSLVLLLSFAVIFPGVILLSLNISDEDNAFVWLFHYILQSQTRMMMLACWLASLLILIPNVFYFKSSMSLNMSRKVWHFALLPLLIPQMVMDPEFTSIAVAGTSVLFLIVEYFRYMELAPIGSYFNSQLRYFTDYRDDKGPIIISYIYLIIGVSLPLLVNNSLVGIISLGVGDSLASIVGKNFGNYRWPGSKKTLEGTAAFILATSICSILCQSCFSSFGNVSKRNIIVVSVLSGILEGNSNLNDNILIPAFLMISMELSKYY